MLIARNKAATLAGLEVPTTSEIMNIKQRLKVTSAPIADFRPPPNRGQHTRASASRANPASRPSASPGGRKLRAEEQPAEQRRANDQDQSGDHLSTGSDNNRCHAERATHFCGRHLQIAARRSTNQNAATVPIP